MQVKKVIKFMLVGTLVIGIAEPVKAAGFYLNSTQLDSQCKYQYGDEASAYSPDGGKTDAKSWKCRGLPGNPRPINVSQLCKRAYGDNYFAQTNRKSGTGWRCVRKGI